MTRTVANKKEFFVLFHDYEACKFSNESNVVDVEKSIVRVVAREEQVNNWKTVQFDWRLYAHHKSFENNATIEELADLQASVLTVGRKSGATGNKVRADIFRFISRHQKSHKTTTVILAVAEPSKFADSLRALQQAQFSTFVTTDADSKSKISTHFQLCESYGCKYLGCWKDVSSLREQIQLFKPKVKYEQENNNNNMPEYLDTTLQSTQYNEADAWKTISPSNQFTKIFPVPASDSSNETKQWAFDDKMTENLVPQHVATVLEEVLEFDHTETKYSENVKNNEICNGTAPVEIPINKGLIPSSLSLTVQDQKNCVSWMLPTLSSTYCQAGKRRISAPQETLEVFSNNDPYRIVCGNLSMLNKSNIRLIGPADTIDLAVAALDFNYHWLSNLKSGNGEKLPVCFRFHRSGKISDIRLIGTIDRVVRQKFGFIAHPFFPNNLYFRTHDLDKCTHAVRSSIEPGDIVAFRVGHKKNRVWALRVWKLPQHQFSWLRSLTKTHEKMYQHIESTFDQNQHSSGINDEKHTRQKNNHLENMSFFSTNPYRTQSEMHVQVRSAPVYQQCQLMFSKN